MSASASFRPATAWCFPHPYGTREQAVRAAGAPSRAAARARAAPPGVPGARGGRAAGAPAPAAARARPAPHGVSQRREVLLVLLRESLVRGHWRVALRRYLMLRGCGFDVPERERQRCETYLARCKSTELGRMQADARAWSRFVGAA